LAGQPSDNLPQSNGAIGVPANELVDYIFENGFETCLAEIVGYPDSDSDGFGDANSAPLIFCNKLRDEFVGNALDCNDGTDAAFPGNTESCDGVDNDWFRIQASEPPVFFCVPYDPQSPFITSITITPPNAGVAYTMCACWSNDNIDCSNGAPQCETGDGAVSTTVEIEAPGTCGFDDSGYVDIKISPVDPGPDYSCSEYTINWSISVNSPD
jgi:hypothetical protein